MHLIKMLVGHGFLVRFGSLGERNFSMTLALFMKLPIMEGTPPGLDLEHEVLSLGLGLRKCDRSPDLIASIEGFRPITTNAQEGALPMVVTGVAR